MSTTPIADYASSRIGTALPVSLAVSSTRCASPSFDSPSVFGRLIGDHAGHWSLGQ